MEKTLDSVLIEKIENKIKANSNKIASNLNLVNSISNNIEDNIITMNGYRPYTIVNDNDMMFKFKYNPETKEGISKKINDHAIGQLSTKLGIPTGYANELNKGELWQRELLANAFTEYLTHTKRTTALIRSVDDEMMAFLSDRYRRLDNSALLSTFLNNSLKNNGVIYDLYTDKIKSWAEVIIPELIPINTPNNGVVKMVFGMRYSNSDFGDGALDIKSFLLQAVCLNGATRQTQIRQIHLGARISEDNGNLFSQKTYELDTLTMKSAVEDLVNNMFSKENILSQGVTIQKASGMLLDPDKEIKLLPKIGILKSEVEEVQNILMTNNLEDGVFGDFSLWKLAQGVSAMARNKDDRRRRDIEEIVGKLMDRAS